LIQETTLKSLKQVGEHIINGFLKELECSLDKSSEKHNLFTSDHLMKFLIIMKTEYPMIFELMNEIIIEIAPQQAVFFLTQGFPLLKTKSTFNDYFFTIVVGFGFGLYNTYIIDTNITKSFSMGLLRINDNVYPREAVYIFETIKFVLENLMKMLNRKIWNNFYFSEALILWNHTNFLMNLLDRFKRFSGLESYYEACLFDSFKIVCEFFRKANNKENLIILQTLEIDSKISILYKEHMRFLFSQKNKNLNFSKEMKAISTKYYFQKHLNDLFEYPEKFKDIAFNIKEKIPNKLPDLSLKTNAPQEKIEKFGNLLYKLLFHIILFIFIKR